MQQRCIGANPRRAVLRNIYTVGYEGVAVSDLIRTLKSQDITILIDIRALPQSRRPGFSKRALSEALANAGIDYAHVRQLGDPKLGRDAARRGDMEEFRTIFGAHLDLEESRKALGVVAQRASAEPVALMCYERTARYCHRLLVAQRLVGLNSFKIVHLTV
jgi:uncharacterized protein (DUF488 family)